MTYEEFQEYVRSKCMYETIYTDSDGREILVIKLLDAYGMVNRAQRQWVGLTDEEKASFWTADQMTQKEWDDLFIAIEAKLKEKNT